MRLCREEEEFSLDWCIPMDPFAALIKPKGGDVVQTLDLLTECLESVHRTRRASLINRKKSYEVRAQRKKEHAQSMSRLTLRTTQTGSLGLDGELGEEDDEELMEEYSVQFASKVNIEEKPEVSRRSEKDVPGTSYLLTYSATYLSTRLLAYSRTNQILRHHCSEAINTLILIL